MSKTEETQAEVTGSLKVKLGGAHDASFEVLGDGADAIITIEVPPVKFRVTVDRRELADLGRFLTKRAESMV